MSNYFLFKVKYVFSLFVFLPFSFFLITLSKKNGPHRRIQSASKHNEQDAQENPSKNSLIKETPPKEGK
jgi:hypothetical protein